VDAAVTDKANDEIVTKESLAEKSWKLGIKNLPA
jgi:hypothetical protein